MDGDGGEVQHEALDPIEAEIIELERELCRLPEVSAARIVADRVGRPTEIHILAHGSKHPKQVVRDVQSVALASFGIEVDRRIVSVVQLGGQPGGVPTQDLENPVRAEERAVLRHVNAEANGLLPWGEAHHDTFRAMVGHRMSVGICTEDLPEEHNRVTLDPILKDRHGIPAPRIDYTIGENTNRCRVVLSDFLRIDVDVNQAAWWDGETHALRITGR